jgi:uncharacterized membrane-anchored protein YitT (DUF2179 family)
VRERDLDWRRLLKEAAFVLVGSLIYAIGIDCFEAPNGLAAGGLTGLATITSAIAANAGFVLPIGIQTIAMNALLLVYVLATTRNRDYVVRSVAGILVSGVMCDAIAPFVSSPTQGDLLLSAIWGGVFVGVGVGLVFRSGGNTGGVDIVAQLLARATGMPLGTLSVICDGVIVVLSIPVFSLANALYAGIALFIGGFVIDAVVDGPRTARVAYVISDRHAQIANEILYEMGRGCTELQARGVWSGSSRPMLMCAVGRTETARLKEIVARVDPDAIMIVSNVHEAFGEGFGQFGRNGL